MKKKLFLPLIASLMLLTACSTKAPQQWALEQWQFNYQQQSYPAKVPGCIHTDLMANGLINDPYWGTNEDSVQWVSDSTWVYSTRVANRQLRKMMRRYKHLDLVFDGLQTHASVSVNDSVVLRADNMFRQWRIPLSESLLSGDDSTTIAVRFSPTKEYNRQRVEALGYGHPDARAFSRSAPYQEGWDWGPKLTTCGIVQPVCIEGWNTLRMSESWVRCGDDQAQAYAIVESDEAASATLEIRTYHQGSSKQHHQSQQIDLTPGENLIVVPLLGTFADTGEYRALIRLKRAHQDAQYQESSFYDIDINPHLFDHDSTQLTFYHTIPFAQGANWIPLHTFPYGDGYKERYRELLTAAKEQGCNMLRVWGGGIYEPDCFFEICDELGIRVWVDFVFAGAFYPADSAFLHNISMEAEQQVRRLARFSCVTLWCGNNEVSNGWNDWGWQQQYGYSGPQQKAIETSIATIFDYNGVLHQAVKKYMPEGFPYWPSSPSYGWGHPECDSVGDSHYWGVWWGELPFEMYREHVGPIMSEYGFQSYPQMSTIEAFCPDTQRYLGSPVMRNHQKHGRGTEIISQAIRKYYGVNPDTLSLPLFVYYSQVVQAYGMGMGLEAHLMRQPHCKGSLYWQLNDSWPVASWSCIDYYRNRKPFYYAAQRLMADGAIFVEPAVEAHRLVPSAQPYGNAFHQYSSRTVRIRSEYKGIDVVLKDFEGRVLDQRQFASSDFTYTPPTEADLHRCYLVLSNKHQQRLYFFVSPLQLQLPKAPYSMWWTRQGNNYTVSVTSGVLMKDVVLSARRYDTDSERPHVHGNFSQNYVDLQPGDTLRVSFQPGESLSRNGTTDSLVFELLYYTNMR